MLPTSVAKHRAELPELKPGEISRATNAILLHVGTLSKGGARAKSRTVAANVGESAPTEPTTSSDVMDDNHIISDTSEYLQQYT